MDRARSIKITEAFGNWLVKYKNISAGADKNDGCALSVIVSQIHIGR